MGELATTPASSYLFNTDPGCKKLNNYEGQLFHHLLAKLLYLANVQDKTFKRMRSIMPDADKNNIEHRSVLDNGRRISTRKLVKRKNSKF